MRKKFVAGNWKMNMDLEGSRALVRDLLNRIGQRPGCDVLVCPPFPFLLAVGEEISGSQIGLGAQNLFWEEKGAYTGEVSAQMLLSVNCSHVIIGHSERRAYFGETDETVNRKLKSALRAGLLPIVCVGEDLDQREAGETMHIIESQVRGAFRDIGRDDLLKVTIAYEPVWAIGTGKTATPDQAVEVHRFIRQLIAKLYDRSLAENIRIQYGGSVNAQNAESLLSEEEIDGALVGGASLKADQFAEIVRAGEHFSP